MVETSTGSEGLDRSLLAGHGTVGLPARAGNDRVGGNVRVGGRPISAESSGVRFHQRPVVAALGGAVRTASWAVESPGRWAWDEPEWGGVDRVGTSSGWVRPGAHSGKGR